jgi:hypothetical protein
MRELHAVEVVELSGLLLAEQIAQPAVAVWTLRDVPS